MGVLNPYKALKKFASFINVAAVNDEFLLNDTRTTFPKIAPFYYV